LYNGEPVPLYEKNEETFYALSTMMWKSIEQNSLLKITKGDIRNNLKLEYEIKGLICLYPKKKKKKKKKKKIFFFI